MAALSNRAAGITEQLFKYFKAWFMKFYRVLAMIGLIVISLSVQAETGEGTGEVRQASEWIQFLLNDLLSTWPF